MFYRGYWDSDIVVGLIGSSFEKTMRSATNLVVWSLQLCHFFCKLGIVEALVSRLLLYSLTPRPIFLRPLLLALLHNWDFLPWLLRQRYCCWTDWVFFWEDNAFSYKHGCLIPSTLSLMFFYRLLIDEALSPVLFYISLTPRPIFLGPLCVALLHNWVFLPWFLRHSDIVAGLIGSSSEKTMRSATNMVVYSLQLCHCFSTG